jgi:hypothetical protein
MHGDLQETRRGARLGSVNEMGTVSVEPQANLLAENLF